MLIFQSADLNQAISADLPLTFRRPSADLPLTYPPYYTYGIDKGNPVAGAYGVPCGIGLNACQVLARNRWGRATPYRLGVVAGEIGVMMPNPFEGRRASLFREGLRKGRANTCPPCGKRDGMGRWG